MCYINVNTMQTVAILYCLGNNDKKEMSVHVQYRHNHPRPNYIIYMSAKM